MIRRALPDDAPAMTAVSAAAGERFREIDDPRVAACADDPPLGADALLPLIDADRAWVAEDDGRVVGFLVASVVDGVLHVDEVSVHPSSQGRGHGAALLEAAGRPATLTTFRDVPWNRPYYERRGYRVLGDDEVTPGLRVVVEHEAMRGLDPAVRVVMRRD